MSLYNIILKLISKISILTTSFMVLSNTTFANDSFYIKDHIIIDLERNLEWIRCSVGQVWNGSECSGNAIKLTMSEVSDAINQANEQLGGEWRLPNREELESLVCMECIKVKIDLVVFPDTPYEPFWTGEKNNSSKNYYWTVNFFTGHTFGRFPGSIPNFARLVRDR